MSTVVPFDPACRVTITRWTRVSLLVGLVGLLVCFVGGLVMKDKPTMFRSYLYAFNLVAGVGIGSLALLMIHHVGGGTWGWTLRRTLEAGTRTLPLVFVLFLPILLGLTELYVWARPDIVAGDEILKEKSLYLNVPFFIARMVGYFVIWNVLQFFLNRWSAQQDALKEPGAMAERFTTLSGPGLLLHAIIITLASVDWVMSLEPHWFSTIFGLLYGQGQMLTALCFSVATFILLAPHAGAGGALSRNVLRDFGSLLLAFVMIWAYLGLSQFLLIWSGNLPTEVPYYLKRIREGWGTVGLVLIVLHFALPFLLLLLGDLKRNPKTLLAVVGLVLVMRMVDLFYQIIPSHTPPGGDFHTPTIAWGTQNLLLDVAALVGVGGVWLSCYLWEIQKMPLLAAYNPEEEGTHHG